MPFPAFPPRLSPCLPSSSLPPCIPSSLFLSPFLSTSLYFHFFLSRHCVPSSSFSSSNLLSLLFSLLSFSIPDIPTSFPPSPTPFFSSSSFLSLLSSFLSFSVSLYLPPLHSSFPPSLPPFFSSSSLSFIPGAPPPSSY